MTARPRSRRSLLALGMVLLCACTHASRVGPALPSAIGAPANECEQAGWLELAPAEVRQWGAVPAGGLGLFRPGGKHPEDLAHVVDRLQEPTVDIKMARIRRTDARNRVSLIWALSAAGALAIGVGTAAALNDRNHTAATVFGISGLALGLVAVIGAIVTMPPMDDLFDAEAGHYLFFEHQDDMTAVARGTERADQAVRQACAAGAPTTR